MSFSDELKNNGKPILRKFKEHPIVKSLAGCTSTLSKREILSEEKLIVVRNNFFLQDYFYLVYAYKVPQLFLIDSSNDNELKANLLGLDREYDKQLDNPFLLRKNPFISSSISDIRTAIDNNGMHIEGYRPNLKTKDYINFRKESVFEGDLEAMVSGLPCLWFYCELSEKLKRSREKNPYFEKNQFIEWLRFLTADRNQDYLPVACRIIDRLAEEVSSEYKFQLNFTFIQGCELEYEFMLSLLP